MPKSNTPSYSAIDLVLQTTPRLWRKSNDASAFYAFGKRYFNDPVAFAKECIVWPEGDSLTFYQEEILRALVSERLICVRSCHGSGKTALNAIAIIWYALTREALSLDWKVVTTASVNRQLSKYLWPEVHKWIKRLNWNRIGRIEFKDQEELTSMNIKLKYGQAFAVSSNKSDLIEGAHADHLLYIFDEAKVIPDSTWASAKGALVNPNARWMAISTPGDPVGRFYEIQTRQEGTHNWWVRHILLSEAIAAGRVTQEWVDDCKVEWGEESALFKNKVLGEFAYSDVTGLIPLVWVEQAVARWRQHPNIVSGDEAVLSMGIDVARGGGDLSVIATRVRAGVSKLEKWSDLDTMGVAGQAAARLRIHRCPTWVDVVGIGAGVYDRLTEQFGDLVFPFHPQEKSNYVDRSGLWEFQDTYSAAWWYVRELLDPSNGENICLPPDKDLIAELTAAEWTPLSNGKIEVKRKEKIKEKLGHSPDSADACVMCLFDPLSMSGMEYA